MTSRAAWPAVSVGVAFTSGVFTETTLGKSSGGVVSFSCNRGRQYELDRTEAGTGKAMFENFDGRYTPGNASSPYAGLLALYNEYRVQATWAGTTYPVVRGYIERWPVDYSDAGNFAWANVDTVDAFALLAGQMALSVADYEARADSPTFLYKMNEPSSSTSIGDSINPGVNPPGSRLDSKYGPGTITFGADTAMADGSTGISFSKPAGTRAASCLVVTRGSSARTPQVPNSGGFSLECWFMIPQGANDTTSQWLIGLSGDHTTVGFNLNQSAGPLYFFVDGVGGNIVLPHVDSLNDGLLHHLVGVVEADNVTCHIYLDGVLKATGTAASALTWSTGFTDLAIGGLSSDTSVVGSGSEFTGTLARCALYPTPLSAARVAAHHTAGRTAFAGEDTGARIARVLGYAGWPTALTDITTGYSAKGPAIIEGTSILQVLQDAASDELGTLWVSGAGKVTFRGRQVRATTLTSSITFGENTAAGEIPYLEDVHFDYDPTQVYDQVQVSRDTGATVFVQAATSVLPYHKTLSKSVGLSTDAEATDQANWLVAALSTPKLRVAALSINPSARPSLWPVALGTEINTRATVKRRALGQPQFSIDCWVEAVAHTVTAAGWVTTFLLSPVDSPQRMNLWDVDNWDDGSAVWGF